MEAYLINGLCGNRTETWVSEVSPFLSLVYFKLLYRNFNVGEYRIVGYQKITEDEYNALLSINTELGINIVKQSSLDYQLQAAKEIKDKKEKQEKCQHDFQPYEYKYGSNPRTVKRCVLCELEKN